jgi:diguanylate cyclase (GGDEF)-like protein
VITNPSIQLLLAFPILGGLMSGLFLSPQATASVFVGTLIGMMLLPVLVPSYPVTNMVNALFFVAIVGALVVMAAAVRRQDTEQIEQQSQTLAEREERLQAAIETAREANEELVGWVKELEQRTAEITLLSRMAEMLQTCLTVQEAYTAIAQFAHRLFPGASGAVYLINPSRNYVEAGAAWGQASGEMEERVFAPDECWALRRGRIYLVQDTGTELPCHHVATLRRSSLPYLCVPMMAQGEALGVLHLAANEAQAHLTEAQQRLAQAVAEQLSLALANLKLRETLRLQSIRDVLTGLFNRRYLEETLEREILRAARNKGPLGVIICDIDHFKRFNDTFGHEAGDVLLHELGNYLLTRTRGADIACRYGGEEFTLVLTEASLEATRRRAEELRVGISNLRVQYRGQPLGPITFSLGVAVFPDHGLNRDALLRTADAALYRAKAEGRDRVAVGTTTEE